MTKNLVTLILGITIIFTGCKSKKAAVTNEADTSTYGTKVFSVPSTAPDTEREIKPSEYSKAEKTNQKVSVKEEAIEFNSTADRDNNVNNTYFVIIGSFSNLVNAKNFREIIKHNGFKSIILHSETGYYRVCVDSFKEEADARERVITIRNDFTEYSDTWLLIKK